MECELVDPLGSLCGFTYNDGTLYTYIVFSPEGEPVALAEHGGSSSIEDPVLPGNLVWENAIKGMVGEGGVWFLTALGDAGYIVPGVGQYVRSDCIAYALDQFRSCVQNCGGPEDSGYSDCLEGCKSQLTEDICGCAETTPPVSGGTGSGNSTGGSEGGSVKDPGISTGTQGTGSSSEEREPKMAGGRLTGPRTGGSWDDYDDIIKWRKHKHVLRGHAPLAKEAKKGKKRNKKHNKDRKQRQKRR